MGWKPVLDLRTKPNPSSTPSWTSAKSEPIPEPEVVRLPKPGSVADYAWRLTCPNCGAQPLDWCTTEKLLARAQRLRKVIETRGDQFRPHAATMLCTERV